jgi:CheY-like chemotaxis protein
MKIASVIDKPKIMIVEDELIVAENLAQNLQRLGYQVSAVVDSGEDAIQTALAIHPDIVLMDIMLLGEIDGIEAASQIYLQLKIPVIYMTAYADQNILERAKKTEPYGYLVKPFKPQDIQTTIEIAFYRYQVEKKIALYHKSKLNELQDRLRLLIREQQESREKNVMQSLPLNSDLATDLQDAIEREELQLYYQPQVNLETGNVIGAEALLSSPERTHFPR